MEVDAQHSPTIASLINSTDSQSIPHKRKDPPPPPSPARTRDTEDGSPPAKSDDEPGASPEDEYATGRIVCECGDSVPIRDPETGGFTIKLWEEHRTTCQTASQTTSIPTSTTPFKPQVTRPPPSAQPDASAQPLPKRRRAKRTEEERIEYLRNQKHVAEFGPYHVECNLCKKRIRLRPNSTYCSIPWDAHRKSCEAKQQSKKAQPVDDRSAAFSADPNVKRADSSRVQCRSCEQWIPLLTDDNAAAIKTWKEHSETCQQQRQPQAPLSSGPSTSKFNIANVPPPPKHLLALASSSTLPVASSASARLPSTQSLPGLGGPSQPSSSAVPSFREYNPNQGSATQESRRRNAEQRAADLRADRYIGKLEPGRVFCKMCQRWVQLRQDSSYCAYPWIQHRKKCLKRHPEFADRDAGNAEPRGTRDGVLEGELTDSSDVSEPEDGDDRDRDSSTEHERHKAERRRARKADAASARLRQLESGGTPPRPSSSSAQARSKFKFEGRSVSFGASEGEGEGEDGDEDGAGEVVYMDVDPPRLADLESPHGRLDFMSRSITHLFALTYARSDELTIAALVTYLNAAMPPDKHEDFDTAEVTKGVIALRERRAVVFEGDVIRVP